MKNGQVRRYKFIGEYLIEAGLLTEAQVGVALKDQYSTPMAFGEIIATRGWVKSQTIEYLMQKIIEPERRSLQSQTLSSGMTRQPRKPQSQKNTEAGQDPDINSEENGKNLGVNWIG